MGKSWSKSETAYLKENAESQTADQLAAHFETDADTVREKLEKLGLNAAPAPTGRNSDPSLGTFAEAMKLFGEKNLEGAAKLFEKVIAETDGRHLRDRSRQFLDVCQRQQAEAEEIGDPYLAAVFAKNQGRFNDALELVKKADAGDEERFVYLEASLRALAEQEEAALESLEKAVALEPKNRVHAFHDPDFESLRGSEGFVALINPPKAEAS